MSVLDDFASYGLRRAVEYAIRNTGIGNVAHLETLDASDYSVDSLVGINALTNLKHLDVSFNRITDITPLAPFQDQLITLNITKNSVVSLAPLSGFTVIYDLNVSLNGLTDIDDLLGLSSIELLEISGNTIGALPDLSGISGLRLLRAKKCGLSGVSCIDTIADLPALGEVDLSNNAIAHVLPFAGLTNMRDLYLSQNAIVSAADVCSFEFGENMRVLWLDDNELTSFENEWMQGDPPAYHWGHFRDLKLDNNHLTSCAIHLLNGKVSVAGNPDLENAQFACDWYSNTDGIQYLDIRGTNVQLDTSISRLDGYKYANIMTDSISPAIKTRKNRKRVDRLLNGHT